MKKNNLFGWDYESETILNRDGSPSRFAKVYGEGGNICHVKKDSYQLITTKDVSDLGGELIAAGYRTTPFSHRNGEVIGLNVSIANTLTKVGDMHYGASLTFPNNNIGSGKYLLSYQRLICTNGAVRTGLMQHDNRVTVTHDMSKNERLEIMGKAVKTFFELIASSEELDTELDKIVLDKAEVMRRLNTWFYNNELPVGKKTMSLDEFRKKIAVDPDSLECYGRYEELKEALDREISYNTRLGLKLSAYTVYAAASNYLSRRREKSKSSAPHEIQLERTSEKLLPLEDLKLVYA